MSLNDYINEKPVLSTPRLTLRGLVPSDADDLQKWTPDKELYRYWGKNPGKADKDPRLLFTTPEKLTKSFHWGIVDKDENRVVGELWIYLIENDRMAKAAMRLAADAQGRGYGTEALIAALSFCFEKTELQRIWSDVDVRNQASCRMMEKCGFRREGLIRQGKMVSTWCDYYIYGILKEDWDKGALQHGVYHSNSEEH